ncbi:hypothetical protein [Methylobacterium aerolatum]|uniref:Uncharacterized protein n=1 Tax=Methylobacterium aerolatum TaxID=418708 RepID=A0ABU0HTC4_9HYPH|nr:hypothetical protein [Methylobacterium aerolatum]MDQ0445546.1 hypothetical protein [Methylobacterium aerolatum]GJD36343.1 hypothetical protein FMGBMHLM_3263 [Methylobacterium aerolatum]
MTVKRITLAVLAAMALAPALGTSAGAQYYQDDYDYRPRRPPPPDYYDDRPRYGYGRRYRDEYDDGPRRFGRICVTARGNCPARPAPFNSPCGCDIPGFGLKRGAIGG